MIDSGINARSVEVRLNEFTVIGSLSKIHLMPKKLMSSFFSIVQGEDIKKIGAETFHKIFKDELIETSQEVSEYIFSLTDSNKIEIKSFLKNLINFVNMSELKKSDSLTIKMVDEYFNFFGISRFTKEFSSSRQILVEVQREV